VSKKDHYIREYLQTAIEAYNLAASTQPLSMYRETICECEPVECGRQLPTDNRKTLLDLSIDIKYIFNGFIEGLCRDHGDRRGERVIDWIVSGYLERFSYEHRVQIKADRNRLAYLFRQYVVSGGPTRKYIDCVSSRSTAGFNRVMIEYNGDARDL